MRRIGSNIRKQNPDEKAVKPPRNIIRYTNDEKPKNEYPRRIVSPVQPSSCCSDANREVIGSMREVDGFKFCYKVCAKCGHAVKYFFPAAETTSTAVKQYREWKRYMVQ